MLSPFELTAAVALPLGFVTLVGGLFVYLFVIRPATSRLRAIPGPKSSHWLYGSRDEVNGSTWTDGHFAEPNFHGSSSMVVSFATVNSLTRQLVHVQ
ncbi:hypothetical protein AC1031_017018 [Aphanomyces cochlioides]|nr:hypothetical protein AC1031_017018 [Aphanomyces cochlioides]